MVKEIVLTITALVEHLIPGLFQTSFHIKLRSFRKAARFKSMVVLIHSLIH